MIFLALFTVLNILVFSDSIDLIFPSENGPHISQPYKTIGAIVDENSFIRTLIGVFSILEFFFNNRGMLVVIYCIIIFEHV